MGVRLLVGVKIYRESFMMEDFIGSDDIFALVISGSFSFTFEGGGGTVGKNEGVVFLKNVLYRRRVISPVTMYLFRYRSDEPIFLKDKVTFEDKSRIVSTVSLLEKLESGMMIEDFELRTALFNDMITQYRIENGSLFSYSEKKDGIICSAVSEINGNIHKRLCLTELAESRGLSYVQFARRFKASTGKTPCEYVSAVRLQKAKSLLGGSELSVREIANACGFENEYYFSNFFKKRQSMSPSAFRASLNE